MAAFSRAKFDALVALVNGDHAAGMNLVKAEPAAAAAAAEPAAAAGAASAGANGDHAAGMNPVKAEPAAAAAEPAAAAGAASAGAEAAEAEAAAAAADPAATLAMVPERVKTRTAKALPKAPAKPKTKVQNLADGQKKAGDLGIDHAKTFQIAHSGRFLD
jgi:membrane-associated protease RseP (regulator of RpoE activity)